MRGIIAVLLLIFGIKWGFNLLGPLAWVLLVVLAQFGPGRDSIGEKGVWKYKHDEEYNHLNPLYVRGYFRKGANKSSLFSNLKDFCMPDLVIGLVGSDIDQPFDEVYV